MNPKTDPVPASRRPAGSAQNTASATGVSAIGELVHAILAHEGDDHVAYAQLAAYVEGSISAEVRREVEGHLVSCQSCAADVASLAQVVHHLQSGTHVESRFGPGSMPAEQEPITPTLKVRVPPAVRWWQVPRYSLVTGGGLAAATVLLAAFATALWLNLKPAPQPPQQIDRGGGGELVPAMPKDDLWIRWSEAESGSLYDLSVTTTQMEVIVAKKGLTTPEYRVPPEAVSRLRPDSRLFWQVEVHLKNGGRISSPSYEITIR